MNYTVVGLLDDPGLMLGTQQVFMTVPAAQDFLNIAQSGECAHGPLCRRQ